MSVPFPSSSSSSSSSSSAQPSSSSSSSSSSPCGGRNCTWELTAQGPIALTGCGPGCHCAEPTGVKAPDPTSIVGPTGDGDLVTTPCSPNIPIPGPSSSSTSSSSGMIGVAALAQVSVVSEEVRVTVPNVFNGEWQGFSVQVTNGFHVFRGVGWTITMVKLPSARPDAFVSPPTVPAAAPSADGVIAKITLPEAGTLVDYWVPVLELHLISVLHASEWTVVFVKREKPAIA